MKTRSNDGFLRTAPVQQRRLITRAFLSCLIVAAICVTALSGSANGPVDDAQEAFDDWKAAANKAATQSQGGTATPNLKTGGGLTVITFIANPGTITVNLPDDMMAGDTISGTVIAQPNGQTQEERTKNKAELQAYVVAIFPADPRPPKTPPIVIFDLSKGLAQSGGATIVSETFAAPKKVNAGLFLMPNENSPPGSCGRSGSLVAINESCSPISQLVFNSPGPRFEAVITPDPKITSTFTIPPLGQTGRPIVITGPFDGNSSNTTLNGAALLTSVQDFEKNTENVSGGFGLIAESPRKAVFTAPSNVTGPVELRLTEGNTQSTGSYRNVGVNLSAPKTNLRKGEQTVLKVQVGGLEGITKPVPLQLDATGVITMDAGNFQNLRITPAEVNQAGTYTTTRSITGQQAGAFTVKATVVVSPFDTCLQDDSVPSRVVLWNTFTGDYIFTTIGPAPRLPGKPSQTGSTTPPSLTGTGKITSKGCIFTLEHNTPDRRVMSTIDQCTQTGSASVETVSPKVKFTITDRSTTDNTCSSVELRPFGPSLIRGVKDEGPQTFVTSGTSDQVSSTRSVGLNLARRFNAGHRLLSVLVA